MKDTRRILRWGVGVVAVLAAVAAIVPLATSADGPSPIPQGCQLRSPQPEAPLALNVVAVKNLAKTIVMEKEVFNCFDARSTLAQIKDVATTIEIVERAQPGGKHKSTGKHKHGRKDKWDGKGGPVVVDVAKRVETETCVKDLQTGQVSCAAQAVPLGTTGTPLAQCSVNSGTYPFEPIDQPTHPLAMSTVRLIDGVVKTVQVEKEVLNCSGRIADVYLFTELVERAKAGTFRSTRTQFGGVVCFKNETAGRVTGCSLFSPRSLS
jgi:hypothetical protein